MSDPQAHLDPYRSAIRRHGVGLRSMLWLSRQSQRARFAALSRLYPFRGRSMLDAGCGQADLLDYLVRQEDAPSSYTGLEAVADFVAVAQINCRQLHPTACVISGDFVLEPHHLDANADVLVFCGSLNTLTPAQFYATLRRAYAAARQAVLFNFLCSPQLAGADWLHWHAPQAVLRFAHELGATTTLAEDYLDGDCTVALWKLS